MRKFFENSFVKIKENLKRWGKNEISMGNYKNNGKSRKNLLTWNKKINENFPDEKPEKISGKPGKTLNEN